MNSVTQTLETNMIAIATSLYAMNNEVNDLSSYYFDSGASSLVTGLSSGTSPATTALGGSLTKDNFVGGITLAQGLINYFGNSAVTTSNFIQYAYNLINGSATLNVALSQDVENIGSRLKILGQNLVQLNKDATNLIKAYNSSGLSAIVGSISASSVIFGCNLTQSKLLSGVVMVEQLQNFLTNQAVTTGDYLSTIVNLVNGS